MTRSISILILAALAIPAYSAQIRNRHTHQVLRVKKNAQVEVGIPGKRLDTAEWVFKQEKNKNGASICLREPARKCLTLHGQRVVMANWKGNPAQLWQREAVAGAAFFRIRSLAVRDGFMHTQNGELSVGSIQPGWWSAMWAFDDNPTGDARSVHLSYNEITNASDVYIEAKAIESHKNTYFATLGFNGGYFGFQELGGNYCKLSNGQSIGKQIIFSLWNEHGSPERNPAPSALARVVRLGPGVGQRGFSGEGSGAQTYKCMNWKVGDVYRFYIHARVEGRYSVYSAYFRGPQDAAWSFIAEAKRPADGILIESVYSFVEDFGRTGTAPGVRKDERTPFYRRAAHFMNPWFKQGSRQWTPVRSARFTAWGDDHPQSNISAQALKEPGVVFLLETGGKVVQATTLNATIQSTQAPTKAPQTPK